MNKKTNPTTQTTSNAAAQTPSAPAAPAPVKNIAIIGGGPAGLAAALYARRRNLAVTLYERLVLGGLAITTDKIANYPGFSMISGGELIDKMQKQIEELKTEIRYEEVVEISREGAYYIVKTKKSAKTFAAVILATGTVHRALGVEKPYVGRGAHYCATCDGMFYSGKDVAVIGGGNSALSEALHLTNIAKKVYVIHRRDEFRADEASVRALDGLPNVEFVLNSEVAAIEGEKGVETLVVKNKNGTERRIAADGVFVSVGLEAESYLAANLGANRDGGYLLVNEDMSTNIAGLFCAGDVCKKTLRQIITACSDGATAATSAAAYLAKLGK